MTPGPGSYFNPATSTTFKVKKVPERLQFFGSTVERFNKGTAKLVEALPGPGTYLNQERARAHSAQQMVAAPFLSTNIRFADAQQQGPMPGPGAYKQPTIGKPIIYHSSSPAYSGLAAEETLGQAGRIRLHRETVRAAPIPDHPWPWCVQARAVSNHP